MRILIPFRCPGGKRKLLPYIMPILQKRDSISEQFSDVFVGGGSAALAVADTNPTTQIHLNDKDTRVAAFWEVTSSDSVDELVDRLDLEPSYELFTDTQSMKYTTDVDLAFQAIFLNLTAFSGIFTCPLTRCLYALEEVSAIPAKYCINNNSSTKCELHFGKINMNLCECNPSQAAWSYSDTAKSIQMLPSSVKFRLCKANKSNKF